MNDEGFGSPLVFIVGAGSVGAALAGALTRRGVPVAALHGRDADRAASTGARAGVPGTAGALGGQPLLERCDVVLVAVRDQEVEAAARELAAAPGLRAATVVLHTSGATPAALALAPLVSRGNPVGTLHPLASLTPASPPSALAGIAYGVEGDAGARAMAMFLASRLGGTPFALDAAALPLYHAGAVFASNALCALTGVARELLAQAGVPAGQAVTALVPLLRSTVDNLERLGLPQALTGPVARGDRETVAAHLHAIGRAAPALLPLYRALGREILNLARVRQPPVSTEAIEALDRLFAD